ARPAHEKPFANEPRLDWALPEIRERFRRALAEVRRRFPLDVPLWIGGRSSRTGRTFRSTNPNDPEEVVGIVASAAKEEVEQALRHARDAFPAWRDTDPTARAECLFRAARVARKERCELAALEVFETGKGWREADGDVCEAIDFLEYYGREMVRLGPPRRMLPVPAEASRLLYEPRGVAAVIAPWNFPLAISMGMTAAALVAGNAVLYKPSSQSAVTGSMIPRIFRDAGLPERVLQFLPGPGGEIGDVLVSHPEVALIAFTGSKEVGLRILELAARTPQGAGGVKQVIAEMGGKNAIILDSDADLDEAIVSVLDSAFGYQGQKCSACSRLIVLEENYERVIQRLRAAAESVNLGPAEDPASYMGAVIDAAARQKIEKYIEIGKGEGRLLVCRDLPGGKGHAVPMAIFIDVRPEHRLAQEEIFGPVLSVIKARDFGEALSIANRSQYALTGAVFSRSPAHLERAAREFRVGNLYLNRGCTGAMVGRHPFGGFKLSGTGTQAGGPDYLTHFMVPRNVAENTMRRGFAPATENG
ncbi:MAG: L-glutamate gamma-semialdehyde dehydrogenase, partial [bacterium]